MTNKLTDAGMVAAAPTPWNPLRTFSVTESVTQLNQFLETKNKGRATIRETTPQPKQRNRQRAQDKRPPFPVQIGEAAEEDQQAAL